MVSHQEVNCAKFTNCDRFCSQNLSACLQTASGSRGLRSATLYCMGLRPWTSHTPETSVSQAPWAITPAPQMKIPGAVTAAERTTGRGITWNVASFVFVFRETDEQCELQQHPEFIACRRHVTELVERRCRGHTQRSHLVYVFTRRTNSSRNYRKSYVDCA